MLCRNCGTEIADKAIVCFRCGAGTTDPVRRAVPIVPKRSPLISIVLMITLIVSWPPACAPVPPWWCWSSASCAGADLNPG